MFIPPLCLAAGQRSTAMRLCAVPGKGVFAGLGAEAHAKKACRTAGPASRSMAGLCRLEGDQAVQLGADIGHAT